MWTRSTPSLRAEAALDPNDPRIYKMRCVGTANDGLSILFCPPGKNPGSSPRWPQESGTQGKMDPRKGEIA